MILLGSSFIVAFKSHSDFSEGYAHMTKFLVDKESLHVYMDYDEGKRVGERLMPLGPGVRYMSDVIKEEQKIVDEMFWQGMTPEDFIKASRRETALAYLEALYDQGEEYHYDF